MKKCCGTCKWWGREWPWDYKDCNWTGPTPDSDAGVRDKMGKDDGETCKCYEEREDKND